MPVIEGIIVSRKGIIVSPSREFVSIGFTFDHGAVNIVEASADMAPASPAGSSIRSVWSTRRNSQPICIQHDGS